MSKDILLPNIDWLFIYEQGLGIKKDLKTAFHLYQQAAEQGYTLAKNKLGLMYENSLWVEKNLTTAIYWYQKAAEKRICLLPI